MELSAVSEVFHKRVAEIIADLPVAPASVAERLRAVPQPIVKELVDYVRAPADHEDWARVVELLTHHQSPRVQKQAWRAFFAQAETLCAACERMAASAVRKSTTAKWMLTELDGWIGRLPMLDRTHLMIEWTLSGDEEQRLAVQRWLHRYPALGSTSMLELCKRCEQTSNGLGSRRKENAMDGLEVTVRDIQCTAGMRDLIEEKFTKLSRFFDDFARCQVVLERPHRSRQKGQTHRVRVAILGSREPIIVCRESSDVAIEGTISACFDVAERKLRERYRGKAKSRRRRASLSWAA